MIKITQKCQNSRLVEGFHPLFDENVVAPPFFLPISAYMGPLLVIFWVLEAAHSGTILPKYALGVIKTRRKKMYMYIKNVYVQVRCANLIFRNFAWNDNVKSFFGMVGISWMGCGRGEWCWHMGMSYLTSLNLQLFKNIAYAGSFEQFFCSIFC